MPEETGWLKSDFLSEDEARRASGAALGLQFVVLERGDISPEALVLIPEPVSRARSVIAFKNYENILEVALLDIADLEALDFLCGTSANWRIIPRLTDRASITRALVLYQKLLKEKYGAALAHANTEELFLLHGKANGASYVHVESSEKGLLVRLRIGGILYDALTLPNATLKEKKILRVPYEGAGEFTLESLGLHGLAMERAHRALARHHGGLARQGLIVISGKEKSGCSTLLYTLLHQLDGVHMNIVTVEEYIEHRLPRATQTRIQPSLGLTPAAALRAALKQDPDVLMVGELRDAECAGLALAAANRGLTVCAGLEASSAAGAIEKFFEFGAPPRVLAASLACVVHTALARRLGVEKTEYKLSRAEQNLLEPHADFARVLAVLKEEGVIKKETQWKDVGFYKGDPDAPVGAGYKGSIGLQEVLENSLTLKDMILNKSPLEEIEEQARGEGMLNLVEDGLFKAAQGKTSVEEVLRLLS